MSRRALVCVPLGALAYASWALVACSLAVDTSGLSGASAVTPEGGDGSPSVIDAMTMDAPGDAVADAGRDAAKDPSLVAEYSFEEQPGATTSRDSSGNERHGLLKSDATFVTDGVRGGALKVSGSGYFVVDALAGSLFPRTGTLSLWFFYDFPAVSGPGRSVFDNWDNGRSHVFLRYSDNGPDGQFQAALQPASASGDYASDVEFLVQRSKWTHVVVTWDEKAGEGAAFLDGVLLGRATYVKPFVLTDQLFRIGEGFVGAIDEVRLFNRAFADAEAIALD